MKSQQSQFTDSWAVRDLVPILIGISGCQGSGKTYSMLELLHGMQEILGGDVFIVDTEHKRATFYADLKDKNGRPIFKFRHVPFDPPFSPLRYLEAIEYCVSRGGKLIGVDSLTHEHSGEGGVMDQSEKFLDRKCEGKPDSEVEGIRKRNFMLSLVAPKTQRKKLNSRIIQMGINAVFCYRAAEKIKPISGKEPEKLGWQPETTSPLFYDMTQMFLLGPGADGRPTFKTEVVAERMLIKSPAQFREWFQEGQQLNKEMGKRMAQWAAGGKTIQRVAGSTASPEAGLGPAGGGNPIPPPPKDAGNAFQPEALSAQGAGASAPVPPHDGGAPPKSAAPAPTARGRKPNPANFEEWVKRYELVRKEVGDEIYYSVLGKNGFEHANEAKNKEIWASLLKEWREAYKDSRNASKPATAPASPSSGDPIGQPAMPHGAEMSELWRRIQKEWGLDFDGMREFMDSVFRGDVSETEISEFLKLAWIMGRGDGVSAVRAVKELAKVTYTDLRAYLMKATTNEENRERWLKMLALGQEQFKNNGKALREMILVGIQPKPAMIPAGDYQRTEFDFP